MAAHPAVPEVHAGQPVVAVHRPALELAPGNRLGLQAVGGPVAMVEAGELL